MMLPSEPTQSTAEADTRISDQLSAGTPRAADDYLILRRHITEFVETDTARTVLSLTPADETDGAMTTDFVVDLSYPPSAKSITEYRDYCESFFNREPYHNNPTKYEDHIAAMTDEQVFDFVCEQSVYYNFCSRPYTRVRLGLVESTCSIDELMEIAKAHATVYWDTFKTYLATKQIEEAIARYRGYNISSHCNAQPTPLPNLPGTS